MSVIPLSELREKIDAIDAQLLQRVGWIELAKPITNPRK